MIFTIILPLWIWSISTFTLFSLFVYYRYYKKSLHDEYVQYLHSITSKNMVEMMSVLMIYISGFILSGTSVLLGMKLLWIVFT